MNSSFELSFDNHGAFLTLLSGERMVGYIYLSNEALEFVAQVVNDRRPAPVPVVPPDPEEIHGDA